MFIEASVLFIQFWKRAGGGAARHRRNAARRKPHGVRAFRHLRAAAAASGYCHERYFLRILGNSPGY
jgi:hypothetical protein